MTESIEHIFLDGLLAPPEKKLREAVRSFGENEINPIINDFWERAEFPFCLIPKLAGMGITGGSISGYGCPGLNEVAAGIVFSELARADGSIAAFLGAHSGLAMKSIDMFGSDEQRTRWLPHMARLELIGSFALTEPDHGSDVIELETHVKTKADSYELHGTKRWIGNASFADLIIVWARGDDGEVGAYVVERGAPGLTVKNIHGKISLRAVLQSDILLTGVKIPRENKLAGARSFQDAAKVLTKARCGVAWQAAGHAAAAFEIALEYSRRRNSFSRAIASYQLVQAKLADMLAKLTSMQLLCYRLSQLQESDSMTAGMASMVKMHNCRLAREITAMARDLLGGNGLLLEYGVARHFADVEAIYTYEGTDAIQALITGREITGFQSILG